VSWPPRRRAGSLPASRPRGAPGLVEIVVSVGRLSAAVAATACFVVAAATTNVAKHARASHGAHRWLHAGGPRARCRDPGRQAQWERASSAERSTTARCASTAALAPPDERAFPLGRPRHLLRTIWRSPIRGPTRARFRQRLRSSASAPVAPSTGSVSGTHRQECLNPKEIRGYPPTCTRIGRLDRSYEWPAKPHVLTSDSRGERVDRTQEVAGPSPPSSIARAPAAAGFSRFGPRNGGWDFG
jgi:hypothetical protein